MSRWKKLKKIIKPRNIFVLILLLASNSLAWFVYSNRVQNKMTAHVRAWEILFEAGEGAITDYVNVDVDNMFPGMEEYFYEITANNKSEVPATLSYTLLEANILGDEYVTIQGRGEREETVLPTDISSTALISKLANDFPFEIIFSLSAEEMVAETGQAKYKITINWPFESGDDNADTYWGNKAALRKKDYPDEAGIILKIKIFITQKSG